MQITFDIDIGPEDEALLIKATGATPATLEAVMSNHAKAALHEYVEAYVGRRAFSRGTDMLEHRLSLLIRHALAGKVPDEAGISSLFQTTLSTSRTLLRNTLFKYRFDLTAATDASARALLETVVWRGDVFHARGASTNLVELLNQRLAGEDPTMKTIARVPESVGTYAIDPLAYDLLVPLFGAHAVPAQ